MYITHELPAPVFDDDFTARARIEVRYVDRPMSMPLTRLDRHGLTVTIAGADRPVIGLPRRALIVADGATLCELRLVARSTAPMHGDCVAATLQPSRADDHDLLWQALRAYQLHLCAVASGDESARWAGPMDCGAAVTTPHAVRAPRGTTRSNALPARASERPHATASLWESESGLHSVVSCDAAFSLASQEDAWFFSHWLDYHFEEIRAWARMSDGAADLREIFMRVADHEVEVRFMFQSSERAVRAATETACGCIKAQAARQLAMTVDYCLPGSAANLALPVVWSGRAAVGAAGASVCAFSSK